MNEGQIAFIFMVAHALKIAGCLIRRCIVITSQTGPNFFFLSFSRDLVSNWGFPYPSINNSVQAEKKKIATPTFLDPFDLRVHMPGHFPP